MCAMAAVAVGGIFPGGDLGRRRSQGGTTEPGPCGYSQLKRTRRQEAGQIGPFSPTPQQGWSGFLCSRSSPEELGGDGAREGTAIKEGLDVGALDALADAGAALTRFQLAGCDPVPNRLLVCANDAGKIGDGETLVPEERIGRDDSWFPTRNR
jgi:hypothetical protein